MFHDNPMRGFYKINVKSQSMSVTQKPRAHFSVDSHDCSRVEHYHFKYMGKRRNKHGKC